MPELYTFVTERTDNKKALEDVKSSLKEHGVDFTEHEIRGHVAHSFLSGYNYEEDCGLST